MSHQRYDPDIGVSNLVWAITGVVGFGAIIGLGLYGIFTGQFGSKCEDTYIVVPPDMVIVAFAQVGEEQGWLNMKDVGLEWRWAMVDGELRFEVKSDQTVYSTYVCYRNDTTEFIDLQIAPVVAGQPESQ